MEPRFEPIKRRFVAGNKWFVFDFELDEFSLKFRSYPTKKDCQLAIDTYLRYLSKYEQRKQNHNLHQQQRP